jgi:LacI family transcriptional regulator
VVNVLGDFEAFAQTAVAHLRQLGLRSLALLVLEEGPQVRQRLVAPFLREARPTQPTKAALIFPAERDLLWNPEAKVAPVPKPLAAWLKQLSKPVGILCPHLGGGCYLVRCCRELGLRVPQDVAIVGSDDTDLSLACQPSVTSVLLSMETLGFEAMRTLVDLMAGKPAPAPTVRIKCFDLVVRESTGRRRPEICDIAGALDCIRKQATHGVTVEEVMRQTQSVSRVTFHRRFQEAVGKTPAEAIRDHKLEEVRRLLAGTELPVQAVAELCGFSSAQVLARLFRSVERMTLRDYRLKVAAKEARSE